VFVDTSAWLALVSQRDSRHDLARAFFRSIVGQTRLVTSNYVLGESVTWLTYRQGRRQAVTLYSMIESALKTNLLTMEWITPAVHERAWSLYERFDDRLLSFCDCTSFALCDSGEIDYVFGFDRDFQIAGFETRP
jgi:hypothetical protein